MEQTKKQVIAKILDDLCGLKDKLYNMETFFSCPDFMQITPAQKKLLEEQYDLMQKYKVVLLKRVYLLRFELAKENAKTKAPEETEADLSCKDCKNRQKEHYESPCGECDIETHSNFERE